MAERTVLIIEDDPTLLRGLKDNFQSKAYRVQTACDGEAGLAAALNGGPDLILLDIMLPKLNGYEICRVVRERGLDVPIIMLTAKGQEEDIIRGLNLGADDYVTKPFNIRELLARAKAFLRRRKGAVSEAYRFGDCELDLASHKLLRNGTEVTLTPKEFRLLEYFVTRTGRALTRDDILRLVWGDSVVVTSRSIDRCVRTLRSKIEPDPGRPTLIQTIPDIGYRFEMPDNEPSSGDEYDDENDHHGAQSGAFASLKPGDPLGRYEIHSLLGRGGAAEVYRAHDSRLGRDVAIKVLSRHVAGSANQLMRFEREMRAVAALSHRNIVAIHDVATDHGMSFAVMELLNGETLRERIGRTVIEWESGLAIAIAVAEGLSAAHGKGFIHRDIKPGNIFLTDQGDTKILDFGLARLNTARPLRQSDATSTISAETSLGTIVGTVEYMSPEQVRGQSTDARSDIFSLGVVLYEMLTGHRPFSRGTAADTMAAILHETPPELTHEGPSMPSGLQRIVDHCLEKEPHRRFQTAPDLSFALGGVKKA